MKKFPEHAEFHRAPLFEDNWTKKPGDLLFTILESDSKIVINIFSEEVRDPIKLLRKIHFMNKFLSYNVLFG